MMMEMTKAVKIAELQRWVQSSSMIQWNMEHEKSSRQRCPKRTGHNFLNQLMRGRVGGIENT